MLHSRLARAELPLTCPGPLRPGLALSLAARLAAALEMCAREGGTTAGINFTLIAIVSKLYKSKQNFNFQISNI